MSATAVLRHRKKEYVVTLGDESAVGFSIFTDDGLALRMDDSVKCFCLCTVQAGSNISPNAVLPGMVQAERVRHSVPA